MALVTFKDLCIDAQDPYVLAAFWGPALGLDVEQLDDGDARLSGADPTRTVWINRVPEAKTVKQRIHLDVFADSLDAFADAPRLSAPGKFRWTVIADPEGGELCVFTRPESPVRELKDVVVDTPDPVAIAQWWGDVLGGTVVHDDGYSYLDEVPGVPFDDIDFVSVREAKTVKNRIHWDVTLTDGASLIDLIDRGATLVRAQDQEIGWSVMADPDGNEFCVFASS